MRLQATLARSVRISGIGLHSGRHVDLTLHPAEAGHGIVFYRSDVDTFIPALAEEAGRFEHATSLGAKGHDVSTVEHLLAAAFGFGLDNLLVEVNGPEIPILDGSAAPWLETFRQAGVVRQGSSIFPYTPKQTLVVSGSNGKRIEIRQARELRITYTIDFPHAIIGRQSITIVVSPDTFARHLSSARTFGFLAEYQTLKAHGLARGADAHNCIVLGEDRVENGALRFPDEFVRHKALDLLGDLALVGRPILGHVIANRAGHAMHAALAGLLREQLLAGSEVSAHQSSSLAAGK